jgi:hypothetical protein
MVDWQIEISHSPATLADKVMVRQGGGLEAVKPASKVESAHQPLFHKNPQVPIDSTQTEVWELLSHSVEQPLRRRVAPGLSKDFEYSITLSTSTSSFRHFSPIAGASPLFGIVSDYATQPTVVKQAGSQHLASQSFA